MPGSGDETAGARGPSPLSERRFAMRRFRFARGRWFLLGVVAGAFLAGGAVALAAIPDSSGVIHGCYQKNVGNLRVIDPDAGDDPPAAGDRDQLESGRPVGPVRAAVASRASTGTTGATGAEEATPAPLARRARRTMPCDDRRAGSEGRPRTPPARRATTGAAGRQGPARPARAAQHRRGGSCEPRRVASPGSTAPRQHRLSRRLPPRVPLTFHIVSHRATRSNARPGGCDANAGTGCSVTDRGASDSINLMRGTTRSTSREIVSRTRLGQCQP